MPFHIGTRNLASGDYRLIRIDTGQLLFDCNITTPAGVPGSMRVNGIVRAVIAAASHLVAQAVST